MIMVTAKEAEFDKVKGLESGADDYITKPFGMMEFVARVKAVLRRAQGRSEERELHCKGLRVNVSRHEVCYQGEVKELTERNLNFWNILWRTKDWSCPETRSCAMCGAMILTEKRGL